MSAVEVYLEIGKKKAIAAAVDWPGWCRIGNDETTALQALLDYAPRYARVVGPAKLPFPVPNAVSDLRIVERLPGKAATDFGVPDIPLPSDSRPVAPGELERWQQVLEAVWRAFDRTVKAAAGKELRKGPRGGGRDLDKIVSHVLESNAGYITSLGGKVKLEDETDLSQGLNTVRQAVLTALTAASRGEFAPRGPRGGLRWSPRYFVRRLAWHELDHVWEIEDRIIY